VLVAPVTLEDVTQKVRFVGNVEAMQQVDLRARVEGFLEQVSFTEGAVVQKGQVLYQIERAPYAAALAQANATLAAARAQLASANATLRQKELALTRQSTLAQQQYASQAVLDQAQAERDEAAASVEQANAQIESANAQINTANLNLSYTTVIAPITGRIGRSALTVGNLVSSGSGILATIVQMSPIRIVFPIPERDYVTVTRLLAGPDGKAGLATNDMFKPQLVLPDGTPFNETGRIEFVNNQVDTSTGTVSVRAVFPNPENLLLPGQYVSVTVQIGEPKALPVVPQAAIQQDVQGQYVFIVDNENRAQIRRIKTGLRTETGSAVESGLQQGETIIVDGVQKVRPGTVVTPSPAPATRPAELKR
jgi:membrane fusion protein (multidrug efflux system)